MEPRVAIFPYSLQLDASLGENSTAFLEITAGAAVCVDLQRMSKPRHKNSASVVTSV
jgi:hypothetical protein